MEHFRPEWVVAAVAITVQAWAFIKYIHKRITNEELNRVFVQQMATDHLPYIYDVMKKIAENQGIELPPRPEIVFVQLNGNGAGKRKAAWHRMT